MDRPPHVLCALYPAMGHLLPTLPVIEELVRAGCRVTATVSPEIEDRVRSLGASTVRYRTPLDARLPDYTTYPRLAEAIAVLLDQILGVSPVIDEAGLDRPDVLVHDIALAVPGRVLAAKWGVPNARVLPIFASNEHFSIDAEFAKLAAPPPPDAPPHPAVTRYNRRLVDYLEGHGLSDDAAGAALAGTGELSVVFLPREFQIAADTFGDDHVFVGPSVSTPVGGWAPPPDAGPVVLISMGTSTFYPPEFFADCARAFEGSPWHVVIALGSQVSPAELGPLPANVEVHPWIPVGEVLRHASAYLCQGGLSGVMESVHHGTPMVVVPHQPEQITNARRVEELGVGLVLEEASVTPARIRQAVDRLRDKPDIAPRLAALREAGARAGGAVRAAQAIRDHALVTARP
ncbi:glycosyltransferase [Actinokineospora auranticolor]|uniref:MGT family glycosyltransferase n=1 Tax=Actinokineospora auranticolor TaxID=155976 RepID=A0A2S6GTB4_9PSEU|nr:macrolide family glycosyltransferase [Actinokineospora auranticolor]PPK68482.1 MGT family glycosyltransferase [Actinokineospora auranticolor]